MKTFLFSLWQRRWLRAVLYSAFTLVTLFFLARQYLDATWTQRWRDVQERLAREGETLDFRKIAPDPIPDDPNFCAIPPLKDLAASPLPGDDKSEPALRRKRLDEAGLPKESAAVRQPGSQRPKLLPGAAYGSRTDMKAWAGWLRKEGSLPMPPDSGNPAGDVLAALSKHDGLVSELARGLPRPLAQWTPAWKTRPLPENLFSIAFPHYSPLMDFGQMLGLRSAAAAQVGDAAKAHEALLIALRLTQANLKEPFLIGLLVACSYSSLANGALWELCDAHAGTAAQFKAIQGLLEQMDLRKSALLAFRGELAGAASTTAYLKHSPDRAKFLADLSGTDNLSSTGWPELLQKATLSLVPGGWFDANEAVLAQWQFKYSIQPLRDAGLKAMISEARELETLLRDHQMHKYSHLTEWWAMVATPAVSSVATRVGYTQCQINEAIAACALERYYAEHHSYPDALEAANPPGEPPIPIDLLSGKPMHYRKTPNGRYTLWCEGLDGKDDGGKRTLDPLTPSYTRFYDSKYLGDWVWDYK